MVNIDLIIAELKSASIHAEISSSDPLIINGGTEVRDAHGIKLFSRGFSVRFSDAGCLVRLPRGQLVDNCVVSEASMVAPLIIEHYRRDGFIS